jgi:NRAMP (natural resistance-associated macrophage protein)-like metal ion transporter
LNWFIAEFSAVITDIPEVIGIGIALNVFWGWPYVAGVLLSLLTTLGFLALQRYGMQPLEAVICVLVGVMAMTIWVESALAGYDSSKYLAGWAYGFIKTEPTTCGPSSASSGPWLCRTTCTCIPHPVGHAWFSDLTPSSVRP